MSIDCVHLLILNYNGRALLEECLPSIVEAAGRSPITCRVSVVDNESSDDSRDWLARNHPTIGVVAEKNDGLASFNRVLRTISEPIALLLNNDVKLEPDALEPLIRPFQTHADALFSAPLCWTFDGRDYEGMRTRVRSRFGLVQGMSRVPGHESKIHVADLTAAAGPVLAVDRCKFLEIGGYDPIYFPGRIEDLDLGFRGWMAGYRGYYVPESVAYHQGFGTFAPRFGRRGCDRLASRNTLVFTWKNLSGSRLFSHFAWLPVRIARSLVCGRLDFTVAVLEALARLGRIWSARRALAVGQGSWVERQEAFFQRFRW